MAAWPPLPPTPEQQAVLYRIAAQRARFYERRELRAQYRAAVRAQQGLPPDASVAMRAGAFARQHPLALVAAAGAVYAIGPKRLLGWVNTALPILVRLRALR